ncbi:hypothetical protein COJ90_28280, partial [Priestia megaterium]
GAGADHDVARVIDHRSGDRPVQVPDHAATGANFLRLGLGQTVGDDQPAVSGLLGAYSRRLQTGQRLAQNL